MAVSVQDLLDKIHFHVIYSTETALQKEITTSEIMRPGLEMAGYFDYFTPERIQLFGMKEWSYMMTVVGDKPELAHVCCVYIKQATSLKKFY